MAPDAESPWSSGLPAGIPAAVLGRLPSHADRVRFAAVCRPWRAAARHHQHAPPSPLPWFAPLGGTFFSFPGSSAFKFPAAARYHGSCDDWLVFERGDNGGYLLLNPFSGDTTRLPNLSCVRNVVPDGAGTSGSGSVTLGITDDERAPSETSLRKMLMCPHQVVVAIVGDRRRGKIAICRPGADCWLISAHDPWRELRDIAFYDGKVHAVDERGRLYARAVGEDTRTGEPMVSMDDRVITAPARRCYMPATRYLIVSGGRLLMVHRVLRSDATSEFTVFKANLTESRWVDQPSVGADTALFVGQWSSVARRVSRYAMPGNRIHFLDDYAFSRHHFGGYPFSGDHFGAYDMMRDGRTCPLLPPRELHNDSDTPATWLFPREEEGAFSWCDLLLDVFGQVMRLLPSVDERLSLGLVCHNWRASVRRHQRRHPPAVAHLAFSNGRVFRYPEPTSHLFHDYAAFRGAACDDWLLFDDDDGDGVLRLMSPFSEKTRLLPSLSGIHAWDEPIEIENEPAPKGAPPEWRGANAMAVQKLLVCPDGLIAAIVGREYFAKVALCSLDTFAWSFSTHDRWRWYEDIAFGDGKVYALTADEGLLAFEVGIDGNTGNSVVSHVKRVIQGQLPRPSSAKVRYLVRSRGGALLMVRRHFLAGETTVRFAVFRADLGSSRWEEVSTLAARRSSWGGRCSRAVRARGTVRGDQIFFLWDECVPLWEERRRDRPDHHAGVYDMTDGMITDILPRRPRGDGPVPTTWLFRDADVDELDSDHNE
ncbi:hypothetical protein BAE44_0012929 [Dichanthelium oligosanthes]|uniref:F-box domain-containing protein n=1 Tax=Dichanthelium oligosanthes TaxID=888268 RepID=A0A1E5VLV6_9POAL|nr:hypothetical protein BAE44_0012929 [Dichanthelium oligosanthes]